MELSPAYVEVSVLRWQAVTGKEAVLKATGQSFSEAAAARGVEVGC
jgi:phosphopantetheinyl transferase (holo-ACP synthase)